MADFAHIYSVISRIPAGQVATYGSIALACGMPRGAQVVGWALGGLESAPAPDPIPWHRVVGKGGKLTIQNRRVSPADQAELLVSEGNLVDEKADGFYVRNPTWYDPAQ